MKGLSGMIINYKAYKRVTSNDQVKSTKIGTKLAYRYLF